MNDPKTLKIATENEQFIEWMRKHSDPRVLRAYAALQADYLLVRARGRRSEDQTLKAERNRHQAAFQALRRMAQIDEERWIAMEELKHVAEEADNIFVVAGAIDLLLELGAENELELLKKGPLPQKIVEVAENGPHPDLSEDKVVRSGSTAIALTILKRLDQTEALRKMRNHPRVFANLYVELYGIALTRSGSESHSRPAPAWDDWTLRKMFDLLIDKQPFSQKRAMEFLNKMSEQGPIHSDLYSIVTMLATLRVMTRSPYFLVQPYTEQSINDAWREITRTPWRIQEGLDDTYYLGSLAEKVGQLLHRTSGDRAVDAFLARMFRIAFLEQLSGASDLREWMPEELGARLYQSALQESDLMRNPDMAAEAQLLAIAESAAAVNSPVQWLALYHEAALLSPHVSLSELGQQLINHPAAFEEPMTFESALEARPRELDRRAKRWRVYAPKLEHLPAVDPLEPLFDYVAPVESPTPLELRRMFVQFLHQMTNPGHYTTAKTLDRFFRNPELLRMIAEGLVIQTTPDFFEIHVDARCHNSCLFCRGGIRVFEGPDPYIGIEHLLKIVDAIHEVNPRAFIRFSGWRGDPLMDHRGMRRVLARVNKYRMRWGIVADGIALDKPGIMDEAMHAEYVHVSLDAGSEQTYQSLKQGKKGFYTRVMNNLKVLVERRKETRSKVQVVVSCLLQPENVHQLVSMSKSVRDLGVDQFQLKMQHFDPHRGMTAAQVRRVYERLIPRIRKLLEGSRTRLMPLQSEPVALVKIAGTAAEMSFERCYAWLAGGVTIRPHNQGGGGVIERCCHYAMGALGSVGITTGPDLVQILKDAQRPEIAHQDPRGICTECPPYDLWLNKFMDFYVKAHRSDPTFDPWARRLMTRVVNTLKGDLLDERAASDPELAHLLGSDVGIANPHLIEDDDTGEPPLVNFGGAEAALRLVNRSPRLLLIAVSLAGFAMGWLERAPASVWMVSALPAAAAIVGPLITKAGVFLTKTAPRSLKVFSEAA
jgi:MoaA/NifB/PqqE/SkfB family radical SAM enzyme